MAETLEGTPIRTGFTASRSPSTGNVATAGALVAGDIIAVFLRAGTSTATITVPATWVNPLGANTVIFGNSGVTGAFLYHVVTSGEASANTVAWTLTNLWDSTQTGATYSQVVRGVDQVTVVDATGNLSGGAATTTHVLAGLTGSDITVSGDIVLRGVGGDTSSTYATAPAGNTFLVKNAGGQNTGALLRLDATTTAGVAVATDNITAGGSANYVSITVAFTLSGGAPADTTKFFFAA